MTFLSTCNFLLLALAVFYLGSIEKHLREIVKRGK
jgi:hypothetical protein